MALRTYLTGIADAIREKKGTSDPINAQDFASEISSISTGGGENLLQTLVDGKGNYMSYLFRGVAISDEALKQLINSINWTGKEIKFAGETFSYNPQLTSIILPDAFRTIDTTSYMFAGDTKLTSVQNLYLNNATAMSGMFYDCKYLTDIPALNTDKVNAYDQNSMFAGCTRLPKIDITKLATNAGSFASGCQSLRELIIRTMDTLPSYAYNILNKCDHLSAIYSAYNPEALQDGRIYIPEDKVDALKAATGWSDFADVIVSLNTYPDVQYQSTRLIHFKDSVPSRIVLDDIGWWYPSATIKTTTQIVFECTQDMSDKTLKFEIVVSSDISKPIKFGKLDVDNINTADNCELYMTTIPTGTYTVEYTNIPVGTHYINIELPEINVNPRYNQFKFRRVYPED